MDYRSLYGLNIVEIQEAVEVDRGWKERLLSLPWRPGQKTKWVKNPACPPYGQVLGNKTTIYASTRTVAEIKRLASNRDTSNYIKAHN